MSRRMKAAVAAALGSLAAVSCGVTIAWAADAAPPATAAPPPPLSAYGHLPSIEQVAMAPDGSALATIYTDGETRKLVVVSLPDQKITRVLNAGAAKLRWIQWAGPHHLLLTVSNATTVMDIEAPKYEWYVTTDLNLEKGTIKPAISGIENAMNVTYGAPMVRIVGGHPYAFIRGQYFVQHEGQVALFQVDLDHDSAVVLDAGFTHTDDWLVDAAGRPLVEHEHDDRRDTSILRVMKSGHGLETVKLKGDDDAEPDIMGLGRDGHAIVFSTTVDGKPALRELNPGDANWGDPIASMDGLEGLFDGDGHIVGTHALVGDQDDYHFFNAHDQAVWNAVVRAYPGSRVTFEDWSADHNSIVVLVDSPTEGPAYAYINMTSHHAAWLGDQYGDASKAIAPRTPVAFKAADGTPLTGYLFTPPGVEAKNLPLVVFPHGGPAARDEPAYDWWAQAMASRGYAVLQVNYRGSEGFGRAFLRAGYGQWGRAMQTDLSDGVRYLAVQGKIDPKRVCIVGASYGGYAALAGATLQPDVYRCAASISGPSELGKMVAWSREQHGLTTQRYWLKFMGADGVRDVRLEDVSPADHADQVKGPILLIHGKDDTVVPFAQSQIMADALKKAGKPYDLVVLKAEDHWLSRGATRLQMLQAVIDFLQKNNPPG